MEKSSNLKGAKGAEDSASNRVWSFHFCEAGSLARVAIVEQE